MSLKGPIISIEDDDDDQFLIEQIVKEMDLPNELRFFSNGQAALQYLEMTTEQPFLILCDINMPLMNGIELRQRINESEYLKRKSIPFVFFTTASNQELVQIAYDQTVQGFYQKATAYPEVKRQLRLIIEYWQNCLHPNRFA